MQGEFFDPPGDWVNVELREGGRARWKEEEDGIIRLEVGGHAIQVTRQCTGKTGRPRFYARGLRSENGGVIQARDIGFLARRLDEVLKWHLRMEKRLARIEKKVGIIQPAKEVTTARNPEIQPRRKKDRYFNPFVVDWRGTKQFFQIPDWVARSPLTPIAQIVYSRLLFPLAGADGFCERFDKANGVVFGLNCGALARQLGKDKPDYIEKVLKALCQMRNPCIELHGGQGQKKTLRFLRNRWMSRDWLKLCKVPSDKSSEVQGETSAKLSEVVEQLPLNHRKFTLTKRMSGNESRGNESPACEASTQSVASNCGPSGGTRALSSDEDSEEEQERLTTISRAKAKMMQDITARDAKEASQQGARTKKQSSLESAKEEMERLRKLLSKREMEQNEGMWIKRCQKYPRHFLEAVGQLEIRVREGAKIENRAAWLTDVFECFKEGRTPDYLRINGKN